jgi:hypothetical protein
MIQSTRPHRPPLTTTHQAMDMNSYFNDTAAVVAPPSPFLSMWTLPLPQQRTKDQNGKRVTSVTAVPPPTSPNGRHSSAQQPPLFFSPASRSSVSSTAVPTVRIATNLYHHLHQQQQQQQEQPSNNSLPPLRCDETRYLVKQFIAAIWNRGDLESFPTCTVPACALKAIPVRTVLFEMIRCVVFFRVCE